jgi:hypothetical protein
MKRNGLIILFLFLFALCNAQNHVSYDVENGINALEQQYVDAWKKIKKIEGFRIQITSFSGVNSKTSIETVAEQFKQLFPDIPCYITYSEPNFRLKVGNFSTKIEAYKALQKIAPFFAGAFVLKDQVDFKEP